MIDKEKPDTDRDVEEVPAKHETTDDEKEREDVGKDDEAFVDETSKDSFPTSDPPAW